MFGRVDVSVRRERLGRPYASENNNEKQNEKKRKPPNLEAAPTKKNEQHTMNMRVNLGGKEQQPPKQTAHTAYLNLGKIYSQPRRKDAFHVIFAFIQKTLRVGRQR